MQMLTEGEIIEDEVVVEGGGRKQTMAYKLPTFLPTGRYCPSHS